VKKKGKQGTRQKLNFSGENKIQIRSARRTGQEKLGKGRSEGERGSRNGGLRGDIELLLLSNASIKQKKQDRGKDEKKGEIKKNPEIKGFNSNEKTAKRSKVNEPRKGISGGSGQMFTRS